MGHHSLARRPPEHAGHLPRVLGGEKVGQRARRLRARTPKHPLGGRVQARDLALRIEGDDTGGNVLQNGLNGVAPLFQLPVGLLQVYRSLFDGAPIFQKLLGHLVERMHQHAQFIVRPRHHLETEIALRHFVRGVGEGLDGMVAWLEKNRAAHVAIKRMSSVSKASMETYMRFSALRVWLSSWYFCASL